MKTSETIDQLVTALANAHLEIETIPMTGENPHYKTKFATLADIYGATNKPLSKNGLAYVQLPSFLDGRIVITTKLAHKSGQWIETDLSLKPQQDTPQSLGSAITYGRRYALGAILGVAAEEDDDAEADHGRGKEKDKGKPPKDSGTPKGAKQAEQPEIPPAPPPKPKKIFDKTKPEAVEFLKKEMAANGIDTTEYDLIIDQLHGKDYLTEFLPLCEAQKKKYGGG